MRHGRGQGAVPSPLLTKAELKAWLKVSDHWVRDRLTEEAFVKQCVATWPPRAAVGALSASTSVREPGQWQADQHLPQPVGFDPALVEGVVHRAMPTPVLRH